MMSYDQQEQLKDASDGSPSLRRSHVIGLWPFQSVPRQMLAVLLWQNVLLAWRRESDSLECDHYRANRPL